MLSLQTGYDSVPAKTGPVRSPISLLLERASGLVNLTSFGLPLFFIFKNALKMANLFYIIASKVAKTVIAIVLITIDLITIMIW